MNNAHSGICLLCVICELSRQKPAMEVLNASGAAFNLMLVGKGTAQSKTLSFLGLDTSEKAVFFSIMHRDGATDALNELSNKLQLAKKGRGIAFIADISHFCYNHMHKNLQSEGGEAMDYNNPDSSLICVILNRGFSEDVMEVARPAGAGGGTILHARGTASPEKFFGIAITPDKEMLMIVAKNDSANTIMESIASKLGPGTDAHAVSFAVPVIGVRGIGDR